MEWSVKEKGPGMLSSGPFYQEEFYLLDNVQIAIACIRIRTVGGAGDPYPVVGPGGLLYRDFPSIRAGTDGPY